MKISFKHIFLLLVSGVLLSSCLPDPGEEALVYQGPTVVEFKNHTLGVVADSRVNRGGARYGLDWRGILSTTGSGQTDSSRVISLVGGPVAGSTPATDPRIVNPRTVDTVYVQLVGPQRSTATNVRFDLIAGQTAVEGADFTLEPAGNRVVTIPANSSVGYLLIRPIVSNFTGTTRKRVGFQLLGSDDAKPNPNYDTFYVTMTRTF